MQNIWGKRVRDREGTASAGHLSRGEKAGTESSGQAGASGQYKDTGFFGRCERKPLGGGLA